MTRLSLTRHEPLRETIEMSIRKVTDERKRAERFVKDAATAFVVGEFEVLATYATPILLALILWRVW